MVHCGTLGVGRDRRGFSKAQIWIKSQVRKKLFEELHEFKGEFNKILPRDLLKPCSKVYIRNSMVDPRKAVDLGLLAYILDRAAPFYGRAKLQKTTFLSELSLREKNLVGPHFEFYRWKNGPFSQELWGAYDLLAAKGFAYSSEPGLTRRGHELSELVAELKRAQENRAFFEVLDSALKYCQPKDGSALIEAVYDMDVRPQFSTKKMKVRDMPLNTKIIVLPNKTTLKIAHDLEKLILEELEISEEDIQIAIEKDLPAMERQIVARAMTLGPRSS